jgi:protein-L-isoaspartate(D-aspartate) O-methyltransferase
LGWLQGLTSYAPFDSIIVQQERRLFLSVDGAIKNRGRLVIPLGEDVQIMTLLIKKNETQFENMSLVNFDSFLTG